MSTITTLFRGELVALDSVRIDAAITATHPLEFAAGVLDEPERQRLGITTVEAAAEFIEQLTAVLDTAAILGRPPAPRAPRQVVPRDPAARARRKAQRSARRKNR